MVSRPVRCPVRCPVSFYCVGKERGCSRAPLRYAKSEGFSLQTGAVRTPPLPPKRLSWPSFVKHHVSTQDPPRISRSILLLLHHVKTVSLPLLCVIRLSGSFIDSSRTGMTWGPSLWSYRVTWKHYIFNSEEQFNVTVMRNVSRNEFLSGTF